MTDIVERLMKIGLDPEVYPDEGRVRIQSGTLREAVNELCTVRASEARLREALVEIESRRPFCCDKCQFDGDRHQPECHVSIARRALSDAPKGGEG